MKEDYTSWEYFKEDTPINIKVNNNKTIQSISERSANIKNKNPCRNSQRRMCLLYCKIQVSLVAALALHYGRPLFFT